MALKKAARPPDRRPRIALPGRPSPLGRTTTEDGGKLTDLGCPDCSGVLSFRRVSGQLSLTCTVGHAFSGESLVDAKEEGLEHMLWGAVETYLELIVIHRELASQARAEGTEVLAGEREARVARAEEYLEQLRGISANDAVAPQEGARE
jgi:two-component system chemotaxis response regulator CheB